MTLYDCVSAVACFAVCTFGLLYLGTRENKRMKRELDLFERFVAAHEALAGRK